MSKLTIFRASAGSGKTFRLVAEYLKLIIDRPYNYKHILAVTFTNKATAEMKERIVHELHQLASGQLSNYVQLLTLELPLNEEVIRLNAKAALTNILHDYTHFSVSTIDSFSQSVLRAFARETGLFGSYNVDLNQDAVLEEACDRLLLSIDKDEELRDWLILMSEYQLEEGKNWQIASQIMFLGNQLFKEGYQAFMLKEDSPATEREKLKQLKLELFKKRRYFEAEMQKRGKRGLEIIADNNLTISDFKGGKNSFANYFKYLADLRIDKFEASATVKKAVDNVDEWCAKAKLDILPKIVQCYENGLNNLLSEAIQFYNQHHQNYFTSIEVSKNMYTLGVLSVLSEKIREIGRERNTLLISESNRLLRSIIGTNDAPFIYEKVGNYFHHFMIDEFQDTSVLQWENFKPLIFNSLSEEQKCLIVGDVKQSIYRFRNGDWQLLAKQVEKEVQLFGSDKNVLNTNWRSCKNIVEFNNYIFKNVSPILQSFFNDQITSDNNDLSTLVDLKTAITDAFSDVNQHFSNSEPGYVNVKQIESTSKEDFREYCVSELILAIEKLQHEGFQAGEMAILVRNGREGQMVANALLWKMKNCPTDGCNYNVESSDSLFVANAASVRFLINFLRFIGNPTDDVVQNALVYEFERLLLPELLKINKIPPRMHLPHKEALLFVENNSKGQWLGSQSTINDFFPFFGNDVKKEWLEHWSKRSITDLTGEIISNYNLHEISGEQANLQAFTDIVYEFFRRESTDIRQFIEWWEESGQKSKLQTAGSRNAIQILTIHKSKGLEFPIVFIPFCNWSLDPQLNNKPSILWCQSNEMPYKEFQLLPVRYSKALTKTYYNLDYYRELLLTYVDNLNLLYVALTRAKNGLYVFTQSSKTDRLANVGDLINQVLFGKERFPESESWKPTNDTMLEKGTMPAKSKAKQKSNELLLKCAYDLKKPIGDNLKFRKHYDDYFLENKTRTTHINFGKLMHDILSHVDTVEDLPKSVQRTLIEGKLEKNDAARIEKELRKRIVSTPFISWFNGDYKVLNETTILLPGNDQYRPDRVMILGKKAIVVDYKTGKINREHKLQVKQYMNLLSEMDFAEIEGYLWYLTDNLLEKVE